MRTSFIATYPTSRMMSQKSIWGREHISASSLPAWDPRADPSLGKTRRNTQTVHIDFFLRVPYRALRSDPCLVNTTLSDKTAPFHGDDTGSNPVGDAKSFDSSEEIMGKLGLG